MLRKLKILVKHQCMHLLNGHLEVIKWLYDHGVEKTMLRKLIILGKHQQGSSIFKWSFRGNKQAKIMVEKTMLRKLIILVKHQCVASLNGHLEVIKMAF